MEDETTVADRPEPKPPNQPEAESPAPAETPSFAVPLTIEIENLVVPIERLQALREGAVVSLAVEGGTIPVRILASGRPLAHGTLVSIGDGYGVLIGDAPQEG